MNGHSLKGSYLYQSQESLLLNWSSSMFHLFISLFFEQQSVDVLFAISNGTSLEGSTILASCRLLSLKGSDN